MKWKVQWLHRTTKYPTVMDKLQNMLVQEQHPSYKSGRNYLSTFVNRSDVSSIDRHELFQWAYSILFDDSIGCMAFPMLIVSVTQHPRVKTALFQFPAPLFKAHAKSTTIILSRWLFFMGKNERIFSPTNQKWCHNFPRQKGRKIYHKIFFDQVLEDLISPLRPPAPIYHRQTVQDGLSDPQPPSFLWISAGFPTTFFPPKPPFLVDGWCLWQKNE